MHGPLAQLVEHLTFNQVVLGSSPGRLTMNNKGLQQIAVTPFSLFCSLANNLANTWNKTILETQVASDIVAGVKDGGR